MLLFSHQSPLTELLSKGWEAKGRSTEGDALFTMGGVWVTKFLSEVSGGITK